MTAPRRAAPLLLAAVLAAPAAAQRPAPAAPTLQDAWLHEVLDLDLPRAVAGYRRVAADARPGRLERWIAAARLAELHRLQAAPPAPAQAADLPAPLRPAFAAAEPQLPVAELLARARGEPKAALQQLATDAGRLPNLRPVVPAAEDWLMGQIGPSLRDRWRQRMATLGNRARSDAQNTTDRLYAADVLRAELQGRTAQADALRTLYFADWKPPTAPGDPAPHVARIRHNLEAMLAENQSPQQAALLRELADAIEQRAAASPAAALQLVLRVPIYAEWLLQAQPGGR